jgi:hypothetical protein
LKASKTLIGSFCEGVSNKTISGFETYFRLEAVLTNGTNHLERNIRTVEESSVIR